MFRYRFTIEEYHAIKKAEITLDGITVLAGLNGCGKSTISRWLYGFVRFSNSYDRIVDTETATEIFERNRRLYEVERRIAFWTKTNILPDAPRLREELEDEITAFEGRIRKICNSVSQNMTQELLEKYGNQLWETLGVKEGPESINDKLTIFMNQEENFLAHKLEKGSARKRDSSIADLYRLIENSLDIKSKGPLNLQLSENGTDLLDHDYEYLTLNGDQLTYNGIPLVTEKVLGRFIAPLGLKRVIYIDSPLSVSNQVGDANKMWEELKKMLSTPIKKLSPEAHRIVMEISLIIGGDVIVKDEGIGRKELRYIRNADGLDISIDEVATGMKSFTYLLRLLQNGYIDSETLLIIDEPEAYLHPQWVVKFARILVLIRKLLGATIMVASHDPDMVAALQAISDAEGLSDHTNFYQATKEPGDLQYTYINSGNDVSSIFESFNIAIARIDSYRPSDSSLQ